MPVTGWQLANRNADGIRRIPATRTNSTATDALINDETIILAENGASLGTAPGHTGTLENCQVRILQAAATTGPTGGGALGPTTIAPSGTDTFIVNGCSILMQTDSRHNIAASQWIDSRVIEDEDTGRNVFYSGTGGVLRNVVIEGFRQWELSGSPSVANNVLVKNCIAALQIFDGGRVDMLGLNVEGIHPGVPNGVILQSAIDDQDGDTMISVSIPADTEIVAGSRFTFGTAPEVYSVVTTIPAGAARTLMMEVTPFVAQDVAANVTLAGAGRAHLRLLPGNSGNNSLWNWNSGASFNDGQLYMLHANNRYYRGYTWLRNFQDANGSAEDVRLIYRDDRAAAGTFVELGRYTSDATGELESATDSQRGYTPIPLGLVTSQGTGTTVSIHFTDNTVFGTIHEGGQFRIGGFDTIFTATQDIPISAGATNHTVQVTPAIDASYFNERAIIPVYDTRGLIWILTAQSEQQVGAPFPLALVFPGYGSAATPRGYDIRQIRTQLEIKSYLHLPVACHGFSDELTFNSPTGTLDDEGNPLEPTPFMMDLDETITNPDLSAVRAYTSITNTDQLCDYVKAWWVEEAEENLPMTRTGDTLDFGDNNLLVRRLSPRVVRDTDSDPDRLILRLGSTTYTGNLTTTGTISLDNVVVTGSLKDANGTTGLMTVTGIPQTGRLRLFNEAGTALHSSNYSTSDTFPASASIPLATTQTGANQQLIYYAGMGTLPQLIPFNTSAGGSFNATILTPEIELLPNGEPMYDPDASLNGIAVVFDNSDVDAVSARIDIGNVIVNAASIYRAFKDALLTDAGLLYTAKGGDHPTINISPTAGDDVYLPDEVLLRRATSTDSNATVRANVFHSSNQPLDDSNGGVNLSGGVNIETLSAALARVILVDTDIDPDEVGTQSVAQQLLTAAANAAATRSDLENTDHGLAALLTAIEAGGGGNCPSVAQIVAGILAADTSGVSPSTATVAGRLNLVEVNNGTIATFDPVNNSELTTALADLPTNTELAAALVTALADLPTNAELATALSGISTGGGGGDCPTVAQIVAGVLAGNLSSETTTGSLAQVLVGVFDTAQTLPTTTELTTALSDLPTNAELATALTGLGIDDDSIDDIVAAVLAGDLSTETTVGTVAQVLARVQVLVAAQSSRDDDAATYNLLDATLNTKPSLTSITTTVRNELAPHPTNAELTTALADLPTNTELATALTTAVANLPTNTELATALTTALADLPTNSELTAALTTALSGIEPDAVTPTELATALTTALADLPTNAEFTAALTTALADLPTNSELETALEDLPTNTELTAAVADLPTNSELTTALSDLPTNTELATALSSAVAGLLTQAYFDVQNRTANTNIGNIPTNAELRTALTNAVANLPTNTELRTALADLPTNDELTTALADLLRTAAFDTDVGAILTAISNIETDGATVDDLATALAPVLRTAYYDIENAQLLAAVRSIETGEARTSTDPCEPIPLARTVVNQNTRSISHYFQGGDVIELTYDFSDLIPTGDTITTVEAEVSGNDPDEASTATAEIDELRVNVIVTFGETDRRFSRVVVVTVKATTNQSQTYSIPLAISNY